MIASFLSRIFGVAFLLIILGGIGTIISQITLKPVQCKPTKSSMWSFGSPGLLVEARITTEDLKTAPDTTIKYVYKDSAGRSGSGAYSSGGNVFYDYKKHMDSIIRNIKNSGGEIKLDTEITILAEAGKTYGSNAVSTVDSINEKTFVYRTVYRNEKNISTKVVADTFPTFKEAQKYMSMFEYKPSKTILQEGAGSEPLRILPRNRLEYFSFILYQVINYTCHALLFLYLAWLFSNFQKKKYFIYDNAYLLKRCGWLFLFPQILSIVFYWLFLFPRINPAKFVYTNSDDGFKLVRQYTLESGTSWYMFFIGLATLVAAYIFKEGLKLKEEQALTV